MLVTIITGARPNFMKIAPIIHAIQTAAIMMRFEKALEKLFSRQWKEAKTIHLKLT